VTSTTATDLTAVLAAPGLEGLVVAETSIVTCGTRGFYHYRHTHAVELAADRAFTDVVECSFHRELPREAESGTAISPQPLPAALATILPQIAPTGTRSTSCAVRSRCSELSSAGSRFSTHRPRSSEPGTTPLRPRSDDIERGRSTSAELTPIEPRDDLASRRTTCGCCTAKFQRQQSREPSSST